PRPIRGSGGGDDRVRIYRADRQGAAARVRRRDEPADPAPDGRLRGVVLVDGWVREVLGQLGSISLPILLLALALHTCEMLLNALAWRNILRRAYPQSGVSYRLVLGAYGGGIGLNAIVPAQAGTVAMLGLYRTQIQASTALGLVGAGAVQNAFFLLAGASICASLVVVRPELFSLQLGSLAGHAALALAAATVVALVAWVVLRRF